MRPRNTVAGKVPVAPPVQQGCGTGQVGGEGGGNPPGSGSYASALQNTAAPDFSGGGGGESAARGAGCGDGSACGSRDGAGAAEGGYGGIKDEGVGVGAYAPPESRGLRASQLLLQAALDVAPQRDAGVDGKGRKQPRSTDDAADALLTLAGAAGQKTTAAQRSPAPPPSGSRLLQETKRARTSTHGANGELSEKEKERRYATAKKAREGRVWWDDMCDILKADCERRGIEPNKHLQWQLSTFRPMPQSECILRFLHVSRADGLLEEVELTKNKNSAMGWAYIRVDGSRASEFYERLLRLFNIEPEGGISCTGAVGRGLVGRQAKTLLTGLTRFGLKPDAKGSGKWEKAYTGQVPLVYTEHKGT